MTISDTSDQVSRAKRASLLFGSQEIILRASGIGLSLVAARSLGPGELGRLGLAVIVSGIVSMVASCAESAAVFLDRGYGIEPPARQAGRMRAWITALLIAPILIWIEPFVRLLSGGLDPAVVRLIRFMLLVPCLEALATMPRIRAQRALDLFALGRIQLAGSLGYFLLATLALWAGFGVDGMVGAQIASSAGTAMCLWSLLRTRLTEHDPAWAVGLNTALRRGTWRLLVGGFGGFLGARLDNLLVASSLGPAGLGLYSIAWTASRLCMMVGARAVDATLGPLLPQLGAQSEQAQAIVKKTYVHFTLAVAAFSGILMVWSPILVPHVLGSKWLGTIPAVQTMSLSVLAGPTVLLGGILLNTSGQGHWIAVSTATQLATLSILVPPLAARFGVVGGATGDISAVVVGAMALLLIFKFRQIPTTWIDRNATLWGLISLIPCAAGTYFLQTGSRSEFANAAGAASCTLAFFVLASFNRDYREILVALMLHARGLRRG